MQLLLDYGFKSGFVATKCFSQDSIKITFHINQMGLISEPISASLIILKDSTIPVE